MRIAFLIKIILCIYTNNITYDTIDTFIEFYSDIESLETKIMKKYPIFNNLNHCNNNIVFDQFTNEKYLIVSNII